MIALKTAKHGHIKYQKTRSRVSAVDSDGQMKQLYLPMKEAALPIFYTTIKTQQFHDDLYGSAKIWRPAHIEDCLIKRRAEYFYGRLCAQHALQKLGLGTHAVGTGPCRAPQWPTHVLGSISHTNDIAAAAAIGADRFHGLGIDVEDVATDESRAALIEVAASIPELKLLHIMASSLPFDLLLAIVFSAKESFFKAAFPTVRRYFDFSAIELTAIDVRRKSAKFVLNEPLSTQLKPGVTCYASYGFIDAQTVITALIL